MKLLNPKFVFDSHAPYSTYVVGRDACFFHLPRYYRSKWRILRIDGFDNLPEFVMDEICRQPFCAIRVTAILAR
jgi:hypothetical protein